MKSPLSAASRDDLLKSRRRIEAIVVELTRTLRSIDTVLGMVEEDSNVSLLPPPPLKVGMLQEVSFDFSKPQRATAKGATTLRDAILDALGDSTYALSSADIINAVRASGWSTTSTVPFNKIVQTALSKLRNDGEIDKDLAGKWTLAPAD